MPGLPRLLMSSRLVGSATAFGSDSGWTTSNSCLIRVRYGNYRQLVSILLASLPPCFCVFFRRRNRLRVDVNCDPGRTGKLGQNLGKESTLNMVKIGCRGE